MQAIEFFMRHAGYKLLPQDMQTGDMMDDCRKVMAMRHPLHSGNTLRLSSCWMVITPHGVTTSFKALPETGFSVGTVDRKTAIAQAANGDCLILALGKRSLQPADLFMTYDKRAVRICSEGKCETKDFSNA